MISIKVQAVLYHESVDSLLRSAESIAASIRHASDALGQTIQCVLTYGDASNEPLLDDERISSFEGAATPACFTYRFFGENTGYGKGHNILAHDVDADYLLCINPDLVFSPRCLHQLISPLLDDSSIGIAEARQTPVENPKDYDIETGDTEWASGACLLTRTELFRSLGGFDSETFFMYCEDVDYSWRVKSEGLRIVYRPTAIAFHPKRLSRKGRWIPTETEMRQSPEVALLLARKWGNEELLGKLIESLSSSNDDRDRQALDAFIRRIDSGTLPAPLEGKLQYTSFHEFAHANYRYGL